MNQSRLLRTVSRVVLLIFVMATIGTPAVAQGPAQVQELTGNLGPGEGRLYRLSGLQQGDHLYFYMNTTSGDLDPFVGVVQSDQISLETLQTYQAEVLQALESGEDPQQTIQALRDRYLSAWDDDSGAGYSAALEFTVPADGDYSVLAGSSLSAIGRSTFGTFRLLVGMNAPEVLSGEARQTGDTLAVEEKGALSAGVSVEQLDRTLTPDQPKATLFLRDIDPDDTLYVHLAPTNPGAFYPIVVLRDYGGKPVQGGNLNGKETTAAFQIALPEGGPGYQLEISAQDAQGNPASGDYRLLVGINAPQVLDGQAEPAGQAVINQPIPVQVGLKLQQIFQIAQKDDYYSVVDSLRLDWTDPALAFSPDTCQCAFKSYTEKEFDRFLADVKGRWPDFTINNQQGNRWTQNRLVVVRPDGHATYFERFSTNLQIDFDFKKFPFDTQSFYTIIDLIYPADRYVFETMPGFTEIDPGHGEDEFIITGFEEQISSQPVSTETVNSRYIFSFSAPRYLDYYVFQIFLPIFLISLVGWINLFLKDYGRRIEVATGNLLLFIAFSFSIADNYPHLGYLTFLDAIMAVTFIVNAVMILYNVQLRRLEMAGRTERAERVDNILDYTFPLLYIIPLAIAYYIFFGAA
jgi:Neurotransmitter-gated ion-channel ligand binding domain